MPALRFDEPLRRTLTRTVAIAALVGAVFAARAREPRLFLPLSAIALWFSLGGHYVEIAYLNLLRPRLPTDPLAQRAARVAVWFVGGAILYVLMAATAVLLAVRPPHPAWWWLGGIGFIALELLVHGVLALRGLPSFYDGRG